MEVLLVAVMVAGFLVLVSYNSSRSRRNERGAWGQITESVGVPIQGWQAFAEAKGLTFAYASALSNDIRISGEYRGHHLKFEMRTSNNITVIRAILNAYNSEERTAVYTDRLAEPTPRSVLDALFPGGSLFFPGKLEAESEGRRLSYEESSFAQDADTLQRISDLLSDLADGYPAVIAVGGAIAPALQTIAKEDPLLCNVAVQMLKDIAGATTQKWGPQVMQAICPRCLVRCGAHRADLPWQPDVMYYGCRLCHQSQEFINCPRGVVAVLDAAWSGAQDLQDGRLRVNWLARRALFDFDRVEIIRATDKDVEHFAMQVGNDTDPFRKPHYAQMRCSLAPTCHLAENTLRILENLFGQVDA